LNIGEYRIVTSWSSRPLAAQFVSKVHFISRFSFFSKVIDYLPVSTDQDVTFQKFLLMVVLLKDQLKTKENRIVDFPFSYFSTIQS